MRRYIPISIDSTGVAADAAQVAAAAEVVATCLREHGRAVLNRLAPAEMPKPAPPVIEPVAKPVVESVAETPASPPQFRRVDRPNYQLRYGAK